MKLINIVYFFITLFVIQGCNLSYNEKNRNDYKLIYNPELKNKYEKYSFLLERTNALNNPAPTCRGGLIFGKTFDRKYDIYVNTDVFLNFQSILYEDRLYIVLENGNTWFPKSILLKIKEDLYDIVVIMSSDYAPPSIYTSFEGRFVTSINQFNVGDTIIGEIDLSYQDSSYGYSCDGYFMSIISEGTEEWAKKTLQLSLGESVFGSVW